MIKSLSKRYFFLTTSFAVALLPMSAHAQQQPATSANSEAAAKQAGPEKGPEQTIPNANPKKQMKSVTAVPLPEIPSNSPDLDTKTMQQRVLAEINIGVTHGTIGTEQAAQFHDRLNLITMRESSYRSAGMPIPDEVFNSDNVELENLLGDVRQLTGQEADDRTSIGILQIAIHKAITRALAENRLTNLQANEFYSKLAQIEADQESLGDLNKLQREEALRALTRQLLALKHLIDSKRGVASDESGIAKQPAAINSAPILPKKRDVHLSATRKAAAKLMNECQASLHQLKSSIGSSRLTKLESLLIEKDCDIYAARLKNVSMTMNLTDESQDATLKVIQLQLANLIKAVNDNTVSRSVSANR